MGMATLAPGERIAEHYHPYSEEFLYVVARRVTVELDGEPLRAARRTRALLIPPDVRHRLRNDGDERRPRMVFHLGPLAPRPSSATSTPRPTAARAPPGRR